MGLLVVSLLLMPVTRGTRVAAPLRAAAWGGAALFAVSLVLMQFGWIR
ncbi:MAG: hypothetical protein LC732_04735 [Acidobacteria bacterium]|nr:hypothetical protein [Acidobacteriota bacterium]